MSKLLIHESPLQVLPSLACKIGLHEAILLQQLHYLLFSSSSIRDSLGISWIKLSWPEWKEKYFPFWHISTIRLNMETLKQLGLVKTKNDFKDQKNGYTIDYEKLKSLDQEDLIPPLPNSTDPPAENQHPPAENQHTPISTKLNTRIVDRENMNKNLTNQFLYNIYNNSSKKEKVLLVSREAKTSHMAKRKQTQKETSSFESWTPGRIELYRLLFAFKEACGESLGLGHLIKEEGLPESISGRLKRITEDMWRDWLKSYASEHRIGLKDLKRHLLELGEYIKARKPLQLRDKNISLEELLLRPNWLSRWMQEALSKESIAPNLPAKFEVQEVPLQEINDEMVKGLILQLKEKLNHPIPN